MPIDKWLSWFVHVYVTPSNWHSGQVFTNGLEDQGSTPGQVMPKTQKWYFMPPCLTLSIIGYGSRVSKAILGKELHYPQHLGVVAIEKGAFGSPSVMVGQLICLHNIIPVYKEIHTQTHWLGLYNIPTVSLQRGKTSPNECPGYDTKPFDGAAPVLELGEMWCTLHCHYSLVYSDPVRVPYVGQIELFNHLLYLTLSVCQWPGRPGFNPRSSHSKDSKNGTWCYLA